MRTSLPTLHTNGHAVPVGRVFAISGMCQEPRFRLPFSAAGADDFCLIYLGTPALGTMLPAGEAPEGSTDPYFILRRHFDRGQAAVTLRVDWEGVFTLLSNDEEYAEVVYRDLIVPASPEEVQRTWTEEAEIVASFAEWLRLS